MALSIYKPGQGYYTRMLTAVGAAAIVLVVVGWIWQEMTSIAALGDNLLYAQAAMAVALIGGCGILGWWLLNKPNIVDFMVATEAEMKKVNWPSRREVVGSTIVVIGGTLLIAAFLWVINLFFGWVFLEIGILQSGSNG
jgi:preprotein translocase subunit SecE